MSDDIDHEDDGDYGDYDGETTCEVCGTPLVTPGGCAGTGMCGPCCLGDASTVGEY